MPSATLVLASGSPRRKELLERAGFNIKVVPATIDEEPIAGETPVGYTKRLAREKVLSAVRRLQSTLYNTENPGWSGETDIPRWVVGADTVVTIDDMLLGKPTDVQEAREMLIRLAGREHTVITGFSLFDLRRDREGLQAVTTRVKFKPLTRSEIEAYVAAGESMDKAGAYAVQGVGAYLAEEITGSYTNIVGLPLCQVIEMMQEMGATDILPF